MMAVHMIGSEMPTLARTQMYVLQKHFILSVDMASSARGRDCPAKRTLQLTDTDADYTDTDIWNINTD